MKSWANKIPLFFLAVTGCYQPAAGVDSGIQSNSSRKSPLPIKGTFKATEVWASSEDNFGVRTAAHAKAADLNSPLWRVRMDIDSEGLGVMEGLSKCANRPAARATPSRIQPHQILNLMFGALGLANIIRQTKDELECVQSADGVMSNILPVGPSRNFIGQPLDTLPKNLGVFGEKKDLHAADKECRNLRGVRFINVQQSAACVGFSDASANRIRFLILPVSEIHVVRVNLVRD
jgi:hypothetical protein